ncbi:MAG: ABC transporter substrate-binding protein [Pseudomonadota bacterium]|nr:ABC transporter substrate-binding protein [Pseudomonadota bacterium]
MLHHPARTSKLAMALAIAILPLSLCATEPAHASSCAAEPLVSGIAAAFAHAARNHSAQAFASAAGHYADMHKVALFALGSYRTQLPAQDEARYVKLARDFLGRWMAENSDRVSGEGFVIQSCSEQVVTAKLNSGTSLLFRLAGPRRVADISISGISLTSVLRDKFTNVIRNHGGDVQALLDYLDQ